MSWRNPLNVPDQRRLFLNSGGRRTPSFKYRGGRAGVKRGEDLSPVHRLSSALLPAAERVLTRAVASFGSVDAFNRARLGAERVKPAKMAAFLRRYLAAYALADVTLKINTDVARSKASHVALSPSSKAQIAIAKGPSSPSKKKAQAAERARNFAAAPHKQSHTTTAAAIADRAPHYTFWVDASKKGADAKLSYAAGVRGFAAHEVATHLLRRVNEARRPWANDPASRAAAGLEAARPNGTRTAIATEEGLATLHTVLFAAEPGARFLFHTALMYWPVVLLQRTFVD